MLRIDLLRNVVPVSFAASHLAQLIERRQVVIVTQKGHPTVALLPVALYSRLARIAAQAHGDALLAGFVPDASATPAAEVAAFLAMDAPGEARACRVCGCTDDDACVGDDGAPCHWVSDDLCSACAGRAAPCTPQP